MNHRTLNETLVAVICGTEALVHLLRTAGIPLM